MFTGKIEPYIYLTFIFQLFHTFLTWILRLIMSKTSINGVLNRGRLFIFSSTHLMQLLDLPYNHEWNAFDRKVFIHTYSIFVRFRC